MTLSPATLQKRTKQELIDEFEKIQTRLEDLQSKSKTTQSQPALDVMEQAKTKTPQSVEKIFSDFHISLQQHLIELRSSVADQVNLFQELQTAVQLSREQLEVQYAITVTAESINQLVEEQTKRRTEFEAELAKKRMEFDEQILSKKKSWEREAEEYEYQKKTKQEHDQREMDERQKSMDAREAVIRSQEADATEMKQKIEKFPSELETALKKQEERIREQIQQTFAHEKALYERETSSHIRLLELNVKNLEERLAAQFQETTALKKQAEDANAKAQELAMKAIERPTTIVTPAAQTTQQAQTYNDRRANHP
jgi:hypothetical protein